MSLFTPARFDRLDAELALLRDSFTHDLESMHAIARVRSRVERLRAAEVEAELHGLLAEDDDEPTFGVTF